MHLKCFVFQQLQGCSIGTPVTTEFWLPFKALVCIVIVIAVGGLQAQLLHKQCFWDEITAWHPSGVEALGVGQVPRAEMPLCGLTEMASPRTCHLLCKEISSWQSPRNPAAFLAEELH